MAKKRQKSLFLRQLISCTQTMFQAAFPISITNVCDDGLVRMRLYWPGNCRITSPSGNGIEGTS